MMYFDVGDFERKPARRTVWPEDDTEVFDVWYLDKKPRVLCEGNTTAKIEESPDKKEMAGGQTDVFLTSDLFLLR